MQPAYSLLFPIDRQQRTRAITLMALLLISLPLIVLPLPTLALLIASSGAFFLLLRRPWLVWALLGLLLPFSSAIAVGPIRLTDLLLAGALALWFADGVRQRTLTVQPSWLLLPLGLFAGVLSLSLLQATDLSEAATELLKWIQFALLLLIVPAMVPRQGAQWIQIGLLLGAISQALLGIYQFIFRIGPEWFIILGRFMRASGSFSQPNPYGGFLGLTLPIALSLTLWALHQLWQQRRAPRPLSLLQALFYLSATGLIAIGLLASWSRGGWLGAIGSTAVVLCIRSRRAAQWGGAAILLLVIALLAGAVQPERIPAPVAARFQEIPTYLGLTDLLNQPLTNENFAIVERLAHWDAALRMWERAPWLGVGPGNYATIYPEVNLPRWEEALGHAHNIYLNLLAESGLWGLFAYLLFWGAILGRLWQLRGRKRHSTGTATNERRTEWREALLIGLIGMVCHLSIHNFFDNLFVQGIYLYIALWLATVETLYRRDAIEKPYTTRAARYAHSSLSDRSIR